MTSDRHILPPTPPGDAESLSLPTIQFGQPFRKRRVGLIDEMPAPDAAELACCERLLFRMKEMVASQLGIKEDRLEIRFGIVEVADAEQRFCLFLHPIDRLNSPKELESDLEAATERLLDGISAKPVDGHMFATAASEDIKDLAKHHVTEYLKTDGNSSFKSSTRVTCGCSAFNVPVKAAPPPKQEPAIEELVVDGFVDTLGRTSRELRVRSEARELARAKFDVAAYLGVLCEHLRLRGLCRFKFRQITDEDGNVTKKLLGVEQVQGSLFPGATPEDQGAVIEGAAGNDALATETPEHCVV